jgi:hypothetical protein
MRVVYHRLERGETDEFDIVKLMKEHGERKMNLNERWWVELEGEREAEKDCENERECESDDETIAREIELEEWRKERESETI